jgi:hypothetical protein
VARAAAFVEMAGIPAVAVVRNEFIGVARLQHAGLGFAPELAMVNFPVDLFVAESNLTPLSEQLDQFTAGLTKWDPQVKEPGIFSPPKISVQGNTYEEAVANMNALYLTNQWSDGLPLLPATQDRVDWILTGTDLPRDQEIGRIPGRGGIATVDQIAVALAMAGGRPEYLPVLIAMVQALVVPEFNAGSWQSTSRGTFPVVIVNGPIGKQIRLSKTFGCLGPDSLRPAGVRLGRAFRLILQDMGGATPAQGTMSCYGPNRTTGVVIAEDEDTLPEGWEPLNTEYGYAKGTNSILLNVSALAVNMWRRGNGIGETLEEEQKESFDVVAWYMRIPSGSQYPPKDAPVGVYLINSLVAAQMASVGWTKATIKQKLWELTQTSKEQWLQYGREVRKYKYDGKNLADLPDMLPMYAKPENLLIAIAGGRHPSQNFWLGESSNGMTPTAEIQLPKNWDALIAQAEQEMGPLPVDP